MDTVATLSSDKVSQLKLSNVRWGSSTVFFLLPRLTVLFVANNIHNYRTHGTHFKSVLSISELFGRIPNYSVAGHRSYFSLFDHINTSH